ncbi:hypothetical protein SLEP1_g28042 [Rubroshorea leprosula]|uniref:ATP synthase F0 subunit 8 n=1 Tax=Rubroshorea leprosula TaxID=152421 RepID=A0AAV5K128_9ROSI|nr:hypothetical protein SLEP1_g28042 [Rubroshorea leprosula]
MLFLMKTTTSELPMTWATTRDKILILANKKPKNQSPNK